MKKQRKIDKNIGRDTHVRDHVFNTFQSQNHETYGIQIGEILYPEPEPLFRQNMVAVKLARGGEITSVSYPGAFFEPVTGNLHGAYEGPIPGQMVVVGFENGNAATPIVVNRYPYQGRGNTFTESKFINPLTFANFDATDVIVGHFSGSFLSFNTGVLTGKLPGSVTLSAMTDLNLLSNTNISIDSLLTANINTGLTFEINSGASLNLSSDLDTNINANTTITLESAIGAATESSVLGETLKTILESLIDQISLITHSTAVGPTSPPINAAAFAAIKLLLPTILSLGVKNN